MTLPDKSPPRKPSRLGLYAPFAALLVAAAAWTGVWSWMRADVFRRMDAAASRLAQDGYRIDWAGRKVSGFPFRLDLTVTAPRLREVSGWAIAAPRLEAEAFVFAPDHWVIVAPAGVTLTRRVGGPVLIGARALRASLSEPFAHPPRLSVEGIGLTFAPGPGGAPVDVTAADELHLHSRAGPQDKGAVYLELDRARLTGHSLIAEIAAGAPLTLTADAIYAPAGALSGQGFAGALKSWGAAGGALNVRRLSLQAGPAAAEARAGALGLSPDGRLKGHLDAHLVQGERLLGVLAAHTHMDPGASSAAQAVLAAHAEGAGAPVTLDFQAGQTTLGPVAIGPAPRVY